MKPPIAIICLPEPENACFGHRDAIYTAAECASIVSLGLFLSVFFLIFSPIRCSLALQFTNVIIYILIYFSISHAGSYSFARAEKQTGTQPFWSGLFSKNGLYHLGDYPSGIGSYGYN